MDKPQAAFPDVPLLSQVKSPNTSAADLITEGAAQHNLCASTPRRLVVAITGASGAIYGVRLLQLLRTLPAVESHLLVSAAGWLSIRHELQITRTEVEALANVVYTNKDVGASIASGSFATDGMIVAPCSMKTLAAIAYGMADNLISRAADVTLKERRRLVLMVRETPLNLAHLRNMIAVTDMGGIIFPPMPAFYQRPQTIAELVDHSVTRALDLFHIAPTLSPPWLGLDHKISR